jgi:hypothetical protein
MPDSHIKEPEKSYDDEFSSIVPRFDKTFGDIYEEVLHHWVKLIDHFFPQNAKFRVCAIDSNYYIFR